MGRNWTPSIVSNGHDQNFHLVVNNYGTLGPAFAETDLGEADLDTTITDLLSGQYSDPVRVVAFNISEHYHGFDSASAKDLQARLKPLIRETQPYAKKIAHRGIWVEPSLLAEIEYRAKSAEGKVRHPFFKGIREDL
jgi:hypothetical protein